MRLNHLGHHLYLGAKERDIHSDKNTLYVDNTFLNNSPTASNIPRHLSPIMISIPSRSRPPLNDSGLKRGAREVGHMECDISRGRGVVSSIVVHRGNPGGSHFVHSSLPGSVSRFLLQQFIDLAVQFKVNRRI